jgi:hypothetical protein
MLIRRPNYIIRARNKLNKYRDWTNWFAWYPVRIDENRVAWLEIVQRKICYVGEDCPRFYGWDYRIGVV